MDDPNKLSGILEGILDHGFENSVELLWDPKPDNKSVKEDSVGLPKGKHRDTERASHESESLISVKGGLSVDNSTLEGSAVAIFDEPSLVRTEESGDVDKILDRCLFCLLTGSGVIAGGVKAGSIFHGETLSGRGTVDVSSHRTYTKGKNVNSTYQESRT